MLQDYIDPDASLPSLPIASLPPVVASVNFIRSGIVHGDFATATATFCDLTVNLSIALIASARDRVPARTPSIQLLEKRFHVYGNPTVLDLDCTAIKRPTINRTACIDRVLDTAFDPPPSTRCEFAINDLVTSIFRCLFVVALSTREKNGSRSKLTDCRAKW